MSATDLDDLLTAMGEPVPAAASAEARRIAEETMPVRLRRGRAPRRRWVLPLLVGGAVALTAGASTAAATMSHWGGVSMPMDNVRNSEPIRVNWITDTGDEKNCRAWIELRNPQVSDRETLDNAILARDWSGLGQRLYTDAGEPAVDDQDGNSRIGDGLGIVIEEFTKATFPGIRWFGETDTDKRSVDAWGITCVPEDD